MPKNYVYRMDHDTGFAPHVAGGICTLCGCKVTTVEAWAEPGSWVIGIGGKGTGRPDTLIYALRVQENPMLTVFERQFPQQVKYLAGKSLVPALRILVARHFYYLGDKLVPLSSQLRHLVIGTQGCKRVSDGDAERLDAFLARRFAPGAHGRPNNASRLPRRGCGCGHGEKRIMPTGR